MHFAFMPSPQIAKYMAKLFVTRSLAVLVMLVLILMTLDLLGESGKITAVPGNTGSDVWTYAAMRLPQLISRFLPYSVLLGTLICFTTLSTNSEIIAMKAAGLSAHQILAPMLLTATVLAGATFVFNDTVTAPASAKLKVWQDLEYKPVPKDSGVKTNVWVREGQDLFHADTVTGRGAATKLSGVNVYIRVNGGQQRVINAAEGVQAEGGWKLTNVNIFEVASTEQQHYDSLIVGKGITSDRFTFDKVNGDGLAFVPLMKAIDELKAAGKRTDELQATLWHKISGSLSVVLMPLLAALAAFGLARSGQTFLRAVTGMALGFTYFVVDNFALAMGNLGAYPPFIAAWGAFFLFLLIGETVLIRTEE